MYYYWDQHELERKIRRKIDLILSSAPNTNTADSYRSFDNSYRQWFGSSLVHQVTDSPGGTSTVEVKTPEGVLLGQYTVLGEQSQKRRNRIGAANDAIRKIRGDLFRTLVCERVKELYKEDIEAYEKKAGKPFTTYIF